jgi:hypothetical protein
MIHDQRRGGVEVRTVMSSAAAQGGSTPDPSHGRAGAVLHIDGGGCCGHCRIGVLEELAAFALDSGAP